MTSLVAAGYFNDEITNQQAKDAQDGMLAVIRELLGGSAASELTIASGAVTPTAAAHTVDTEADAASDDLTNIAQTNHPDGRFLAIKAADPARAVVVKHAAGGTGEILLADAVDLTLTGASQFLLLQRDGSAWREFRPVQAASATRAGIAELATSAETQAGSDTARVVTPAGLAVAAMYQGRHTVWIPASAIIARPTGGAATATVETDNNKVTRRVLAFDKDTAEYAQVAIAMPKGWDRSTLSFEYLWAAPAASTGNAIMGLQAVAISDDDPLDAAFGSAVEVTDGFIAATDLHRSGESAAMTVAGSPAEGDLVVFQLYRKAADGSDTLDADLQLIGIRLFYTVAAKNDA